MRVIFLIVFVIIVATPQIFAAETCTSGPCLYVVWARQAKAHNKAAYAAFKSKKYKEAIREYEGVLKQPALPSTSALHEVAHYNMACAHSLLGNHRAALYGLVQAYYLNPKHRQKKIESDPDLQSFRASPYFELIKEVFRVTQDHLDLKMKRIQDVGMNDTDIIKRIDKELSVLPIEEQKVFVTMALPLVIGAVPADFKVGLQPERLRHFIGMFVAANPKTFLRPPLGEFLLCAYLALDSGVGQSAYPKAMEEWLSSSATREFPYTDCLGYHDDQLEDNRARSPLRGVPADSLEFVIPVLPTAAKAKVHVERVLTIILDAQTECRGKIAAIKHLAKIKSHNEALISRLRQLTKDNTRCEFTGDIATTTIAFEAKTALQALNKRP